MSVDLEAHPLANIFPVLDGEEFAALADDIRAHGLREPVVLYEGQILDGRNRYRACRDVGVDCRFQSFDGEDPLALVISLNLKRRHLNEAQRSMVSAKVATLRTGQRSDLVEGLPIGAASKMLNVSERSTNRAREVLAKGTPELKSEVEAGNVSVSAAADVATLPEREQVEVVAKGEKEILQKAKEIRAQKAEVRRKERLETIADISSGNKELGTETRYPIIYADPPWRYENPPVGASNRSIENHYPTMTLNEICALPVSKLATDDALLYLWATAPKLAECMKVIEAWGFEYRTNVVWDKELIGMGYHARNQHEILLIAKRGEIPPPPPGQQPASVHREKRGEHSAKPDFYYDMIESAYPELPKIELFARSPRKGWRSWGNQVEAA